MKLALLIEGNFNNLQEIIDSAKNKRCMFIETNNFSEHTEIALLRRKLKSFEKSNSEVMIASVSGKEQVIKDLADESSNMVVCLSYNNDSLYYTKNPNKTFVELLGALDKEENTN